MGPRIKYLFYDYVYAINKVWTLRVGYRSSIKRGSTKTKIRPWWASESTTSVIGLWLIG